MPPGRQEPLLTHKKPWVADGAQAWLGPAPPGQAGARRRAPAFPRWPPSRPRQTCPEAVQALSTRCLERLSVKRRICEGLVCSLTQKDPPYSCLGMPPWPKTQCSEILARLSVWVGMRNLLGIYMKRLIAVQTEYILSYLAT